MREGDRDMISVIVIAELLIAAANILLYAVVREMQKEIDYLRKMQDDNEGRISEIREKQELLFTLIGRLFD